MSTITNQEKLSNTYQSTMVTDKIRIEKLNDDNWETWQHEMKLLLQSHDLWDIVNPQEPTQDTSKQKINSMLLIFNAMEPLQKRLISHYEDPREAWKKLNEIRNSRSSQGIVRRIMQAMNMERGNKAPEHFAAEWEAAWYSIKEATKDRDFQEILSTVL